MRTVNLQIIASLIFLSHSEIIIYNVMRQANRSKQMYGMIWSTTVHIYPYIHFPIPHYIYISKAISHSARSRICSV